VLAAIVATGCCVGSLQQVCPRKTVSLSGCTSFRCAPFCAHPRSILVVIGSGRSSAEIACSGAKNQHHRKWSHSVLVVFGRSLNQRVEGLPQEIVRQNRPCARETANWKGLEFWQNNGFGLEKGCGDFCGYSLQKTITNSSRLVTALILRTDAENQHDSKP